MDDPTQSTQPNANTNRRATLGWQQALCARCHRQRALWSCRGTMEGVRAKLRENPQRAANRFLATNSYAPLETCCFCCKTTTLFVGMYLSRVVRHCYGTAQCGAGPTTLVRPSGSHHLFGVVIIFCLLTHTCLPLEESGEPFHIPALGPARGGHVYNSFTK